MEPQQKFKRLKSLFQTVPKPFRIPSWFYWMLLGCLIVLIAGWVFHWGIQVSQDWATLQQNPTDATKKKFDASLEIIKAIVGGVGTIATIFGGIILFLNFRVANKNVEIANKNVELTGSRLITERFSKAVEQLGSDKIEVRLGGIYALERIAHDSDRDHWTIMEVLTSFIQEKTSIKMITEEEIRAKAFELWRNDSGDQSNSEGSYRADAISALKTHVVTKDIQAALTVIGRRQQKDAPEKQLDLSDANLRGASLREDANLRGALLCRVNLGGAILWDVNFSGANLLGADLSGAILQGSDFSGAILCGVNLSGANLSGTDLSGAILTLADLRGAKFLGAKLFGTYLHDSDLGDAQDLTAEQLKDAKLCETILPDGTTSNRDCKELEASEN